MSTLIANRNALESKAKELEALLAAGVKGADDVAKVKTLTEEVTSLKTLVETEAQAAQLTEHVKSLSGVAVQKLGESEQAQVTKTEAGTDVEFSGGGLTEKQLQAIKSPEYLTGLKSYFRVRGDLGRLDNATLKSLQAGLDDEGGYLIPLQFINRVIERTAAPTRIAGRVETIRASGQRIQVPAVNYAAADANIYPNGMRVTMTGEQPTSSTAHRVTQPIFGTRGININTWMLSLPVTFDLMEDAGFIEGWLASKFAEAVALLKDQQILLGNASGGAPRGILTSATAAAADQFAGVATVQSSLNDSFTASDLRTLPFQVAEQYIANSVFVMNRQSTGALVAGLVDETNSNRPLWVPGGVIQGFAERVPDTIAGFPVVYSAFMPNRADAALPVLFGDLSGYMLAERSALSVRVLNEVAAQDNQAIVLGRYRFGGDVMEPWRMAALQCA